MFEHIPPSMTVLSEAELDEFNDELNSAHVVIRNLLAVLKRAEFEIHNPGTNRNDGVDIAELIRATIRESEAL